MSQRADYGGHLSLRPMPSSYQITPEVLGRQRATQHPSVTPAVDRKSLSQCAAGLRTNRGDRTPHCAGPATLTVRKSMRIGLLGLSLQQCTWCRRRRAKPQGLGRAPCGAACRIGGIEDARRVAPASTFAGPVACQSLDRPPMRRLRPAARAGARRPEDEDREMSEKRRYISGLGRTSAEDVTGRSDEDPCRHHSQRESDSLQPAKT
jgi:hypothetical protein